MRQQLFDTIMEEAKNENAIPLEKQSDSDLRKSIAAVQMRIVKGHGTQSDSIKFDKIMSEILRRRNERQR